MSQSPIFPRPRQCATHRRAIGTLTVQTVRRFSCLKKASAYTEYCARNYQHDRFVIQGGMCGVWLVCRVIGGGVS
ncbi:hypothetical protein [Alysiella filiformis]|uniref:Uncharacterized protein n=1 Tax=Alysiella filiformis DSM 16848 TaxID=1120981 RepID=A0A286E6S1_9NEIS|nr:hypothetical protein [Alysiella filiformis]QMT31524.1 hypothetical protein H3L97_01025 [Alysiella filiformis]UBQ55463.1 hypothetical protein JF568_07650 [Alysiella filiformis DSM 16848]SOD66596.1 hypothetical protein SAMN02746062_00662 [Alysiella filiformis DSM 16848]